jgi:hypothetical protein
LSNALIIVRQTSSERKHFSTIYIVTNLWVEHLIVWYNQHDYYLSLLIIIIIDICLQLYQIIYICVGRSYFPTLQRIGVFLFYRCFYFNIVLKENKKKSFFVCKT